MGALPGPDALSMMARAGLYRLVTSDLAATGYEPSGERPRYLRADRAEQRRLADAFVAHG